MSICCENQALLHIPRATVSLDIAGHGPRLSPRWVWRDFCFQPFFHVTNMYFIHQNVSGTDLGTGNSK